MRPLLSSSSSALCVDCTPNRSGQRIVVALFVLAFTTAVIMLWRSLLDYTDDAFIASMLVALAGVTFVPPAAKLYRS